MDKERVDLAKRMMDVVNERPRLQKHLTRDIEDLGSLPLANLFLHLEKYFDRATTVKTALNFLTEDVGIGKNTCILVTVCSSGWIYKPLGRALRSMNEHTNIDYLFARAYTYKEGSELVNFFSMNNLMCGLFVESILPNGYAPELVKKCRVLPVCVVIHNASAENVMSYIADGATTFVDVNLKGKKLEDQFHEAITKMFMER